jgi:hypothetical protein
MEATSVYWNLGNLFKKFETGKWEGRNEKMIEFFFS